MFEPHRAFLNRPRIRYELRVNDLKYERHRNVQFIAVKRSRQKQTGGSGLASSQLLDRLGPVLSAEMGQRHASQAQAECYKPISSSLPRGH